MKECEVAMMGDVVSMEAAANFVPKPEDDEAMAYEPVAFGFHSAARGWNRILKTGGGKFEYRVGCDR